MLNYKFCILIFFPSIQFHLFKISGIPQISYDPSLCFMTVFQDFLLFVICPFSRISWGEYVSVQTLFAILNCNLSNVIEYFILVAQSVKNLACSAGDLGSIPGLGRSPGEGNGNPLQYPCLENPMDR